MLDNLTQRLAKVVKTMRGEARLTESNTAEMLREVRLALLEADVALPAVREFIAKVKEKALGEEVIGSLSPGQALVGVVQKELAALMGADLGPEASQLSFAQQPLSGAGHAAFPEQHIQSGEQVEIRSSHAPAIAQFRGDVASNARI